MSLLLGEQEVFFYRVRGNRVPGEMGSVERRWFSSCSLS